MASAWSSCCYLKMPRVLVVDGDASESGDPSRSGHSINQTRDTHDAPRTQAGDPQKAAPEERCQWPVGQRQPPL